MLFYTRFYHKCELGMEVAFTDPYRLQFFWQRRIVSLTELSLLRVLWTSTELNLEICSCHFGKYTSTQIVRLTEPSLQRALLDKYKTPFWRNTVFNLENTPKYTSSWQQSSRRIVRLTEPSLQRATSPATAHPLSMCGYVASNTVFTNFSSF